MLRAVRFQAKLGLSMEARTCEPIPRLAALLDGIPAARLLDEIQKMFLTGCARRACELLVAYRMFEHLFPATAEHLARDPHGTASRLLAAGLAATDRRVAEGRAVTPMFLFAVLLFGPISARAQTRFERAVPAGQAIAEACDEVLYEQGRRVGLPRRFSIPMRELLALQPRFHRRAGRKALALLTHPRFRAAYDFLLLRADAGEEDPAVARWWTEIQELPQEERLQRAESLLPEPGTAAPAGRRRRRGGGRGRRPPPAPPA
jgi:poly(A) polymerase